jgi:hypothetical protein
VLLGTIIGVWGATKVSPLAAVALTLIGFVVALFGWRAAAYQAMENREIREHLEKLVSVTEPSPKNILVAAAAKILDLEHQQKVLRDSLAELQDERASRWPRLTESQGKQFVTALKELPIKERPPVVYFFQNPFLADCLEFAGSLCRLVQEAGWSANIFQEVLRRDAIPTNGIQIHGDPSLPELRVLKRAFKQVGLSYQESTNFRVGTVEVRIGARNPR